MKLEMLEKIDYHLTYERQELDIMDWSFYVNQVCDWNIMDWSFYVKQVCDWKLNYPKISLGICKISETQNWLLEILFRIICQQIWTIQVEIQIITNED